MVICADTSFLFSVYGNDVHTPRALAWIRGVKKAVRVSDFAEYELGNALRFAEFSGRVAPGEAAIFLAQYEADRAAGRVRVEVCNLAEVLAEARRLSG
ncbi:MAG: type II toxin-antitoxin system VapC family toxin, partial [Verrucomicrobiota bacterium]